MILGYGGAIHQGILQVSRLLERQLRREYKIDSSKRGSSMCFKMRSSLSRNAGSRKQSRILSWRNPPSCRPAIRITIVLRQGHLVSHHSLDCFKERDAVERNLVPLQPLINTLRQLFSGNFSPGWVASNSSLIVQNCCLKVLYCWRLAAHQDLRGRRQIYWIR